MLMCFITVVSSLESLLWLESLLLLPSILILRSFYQWCFQRSWQYLILLRSFLLVVFPAFQAVPDVVGVPDVSFPGFSILSVVDFPVAADVPAVGGDPDIAVALLLL
jgi:hypothetical protein